MIVYIVEDENIAQFRYRVKNVIELSGLNYIVRGFLKKDLGELLWDNISLIIIERQTAKDNVALNLIKEAHRKKIKVLFDLDDLVFDYRDLRLVATSVQEKNIFYWAGYFWGIRRIAKRVDGFLATNDFLAGKLKRSFGKPVKVIPNSLDKEQVDVSEKCLAKKKHKGFKIGYFSGSPTHVRDFRLIEPELIRFLNEHKDAELEVVGYMDFSDEMRSLIDIGRVKTRGLVDYLELQKLMARVDVNVAPLLVNDFTNCKSELKFFEAAAVETTTIASPSYTFEKAISDGENGFLAKPGEWYDKLEYLYQHPEENKKIAKRAREYALKHYYGKEFLKEVEEAYGYFAN